MQKMIVMMLVMLFLCLIANKSNFININVAITVGDIIQQVVK